MVDKKRGRVLISRETAIKSAWMILEGMGYPRSENRSLEKTVESVFESAPAADVPEEKLNISRRAVHIAAVVMQAAGLCRYDTYEKCRRFNPTDSNCVDCIEKWLLAKARQAIKKKTKQ